MFFGPKSGTILSVQPLDLHGTRLFDIVFQLEGEAQSRSARLGSEAFDRVLQAGDQVVVHLLMQTVTRIEHAA